MKTSTIIKRLYKRPHKRRITEIKDIENCEDFISSQSESNSILIKYIMRKTRSQRME